ncbi:LysM peptidoglycan-binding domain-containing protein [Terrabacter sp. MAHUQ-38]|uniref:LysM peptidoglycan-binding domain-containing protein n=1 Tax=unclassified Terrabacter TaxID=2630222 RepID=UPI00165DF0DE|nr:LysM peptidoglycan-binding domain-containing protein [Terrabacter sp. MAHUQ-38]MBC9823037.1 LysM peptidoglycan-binding domain-containing protein [Terrabacter sp. MAHUQ-38]
MSAIVLEAVHQPHVREVVRPRPAGRPNLVSVPTGSEAVRAARAAGSAQPPIRLTRFGRLVVALLVAAVISVLAVGLVGQIASASVEPRVVTVQSGQTLSGIAARELPDLPTGEGVVELQIANALSTSHIHTGQQLVIPTR